MSTSVSLSPPVLPPVAGLQGAARQLEGHGWCVGWEIAECCGLPDVRLVAAGGGAAISVEVLVPGPGDRWWGAVRVTPASRQVWRGPTLDCPGDQVVRFVEDLLTRDVEQLPGCYQLLG